ncbi:PX domain protein [Ichthyophthirius multifiliis]|uniref:PX domain protein n=1 Tax=Ichthyophthirius multifiliis TaxID=5932 RepID=G0QWK6_ICHMU|nr:PX domain protein [Ichthyophthirius multifiliis]EGR30401.1 PX domain protein [Ichthyophthirius multifiliis]|eukprot:XP_004031988.1 PX domain protein [Ichthyophthirius multifiliis]
MSNIEKKQNYLYEQIVQEGYDAEQFMHFMATLNTQKGTNVENWTMMELINKYDYDCIQSNLTTLGIKTNFRVKIESYEIQQGSLFSGGGFAIYQINTIPLDWSVKRNANDFLWLRKILVKMYPGVYIPPLPHKQIKNIDLKFVERRKYIINNNPLVSKQVQIYENFCNQANDDNKVKKSKDSSFGGLFRQNSKGINNPSKTLDELQIQRQHLQQVEFNHNDLNIELIKKRTE